MAFFERISSRQNPKILEAVALRDAGTVREKGLFCFEGKKLFFEALNRGVGLVSVFLNEKKADVEVRNAELPSQCRVFEVTDAVYEKISAEKSPDGVFCIAKTLDKYHKFATIYYKQEIFAEAARTLLFAVSVRDPGNLGTIIRSAAAFGCDGLILSSDCAGLYNMKTVRASMGALFDFPVLTVKDAEGTVKALQKDGLRVYAAALDQDAVRLPDLNKEERCCLLVGNEGHGLPEELIGMCDAKLYIPMSGKVESLNAAVAASVMLYSRSL